MNPSTLEIIDGLTLYLDGSDGSMWPSRYDVASAAGEEYSRANHFVRLSDLISALDRAAERGIIKPHE